MKINKIALAVALAFSAPVAFANTVGTDLTTAGSPGGVVAASNIFYISGATAQTPGLAAVVQKFCSTTVDTYVDTTDGNSGFIYKCSSANNAASGLTGAFIVDKLDNGSAGGVLPVIQATTTASFPDLYNVNIGGTPIVGYNAADVVGNLAGTAPIQLAGIAAQIGLSDVSSDIWRQRAVAVPAASTFTRDTKFGGQGFGVAVSDALYTVMQNDQGLTAANLGHTPTAWEAQPSIGVEQYAALITGTSLTQPAVWQKLTPNTVKAGSSAIATLPTTLKLARRSAGSGTTASGEAYFLNTPCESLTTLGGALVPRAAGTYSDTSLATSASHTTSFVVESEGSSGIVKDRLAGIAGTGTGNNTYVIGVLSLENLQPANDTTVTSDWKYLKIAGVSPNYSVNGTLDLTQKLSSVNGTYDFAFEVEMVSNTATIAANSTLAAFKTKLIAEFSNGNNLTASPGVYSDPNSAGLNKVEGQTNHYSRGNNPCQRHTIVWY